MDIEDIYEQQIKDNPEEEHEMTSSEYLRECYDYGRKVNVRKYFELYEKEHPKKRYKNEN